MFKTSTAKTPNEYIALLKEPRQSEIREIFNFIQKILPEEKPFILSGMIGFMPFHYKYASGREGYWAVIALASQKNYISIYVCAVSSDLKNPKNSKYIAEKYKDQLTKASVGKSCIRYKKASDIDYKVLKMVILEGIKAAKNNLYAI